MVPVERASRRAIERRDLGQRVHRAVGGPLDQQRDEARVAPRVTTSALANGTPQYDRGDRITAGRHGRDGQLRPIESGDGVRQRRQRTASLRRSLIALRTAYPRPAPISPIPRPIVDATTILNGASDR